MTEPQPVFAVRRVFLDFAVGVFAFVIVAACVAVTEGQAAVGDPMIGTWVTDVHYAPDATFWTRVSQWQWSTMSILAATCGALTAFNLSLARHVRTVAVQVKAQQDRQQP